MSYDEDLKRRMAIAKQQGWSDDEIQRSALISRAKESRRLQEAQQRAMQSDQDRQIQQQSGMFSSGNPVGFMTSLLPFGEILRKKLNNEEISGSDVALETALSIIPFGLGKVGKVVKGTVGAVRGATGAAKVVAGATKASKAGKIAKTVIPEKEALTSFIKGNTNAGLAGKFTQAGESLKAQARGVIPGVKPQGAAEKLLPSQADEINKTLNSVERGKTFLGRSKVGARGSVNKQLRTVEDAQRKSLTDMDSILTAQNKLLKSDDTKSIIKGLRADRKDILGLTPTHRKEILDIEKRITKIKDVQGLEKFRRAADDRINFARNPGSPDPALEKVYMSVRRNIDKKSTELIPDLKIAKANYGKLESAKDTLIQSSPATMRQFAGQGATARLMGGSVAQNLTDKAGRALTRAGKIQAAPLTRQAEIRLPFSGASAAGSSQPVNEIPSEFGDIFQNTQDPNEAIVNQLYAEGITDPQEITDALVGQGAYALDAQIPETDMGGLSMSSTELFNQALEQYAMGDAKGAKSTMDFAKVAAEFEKAEGNGGVKVSAAQQKDLTKLGAAENIINQIESGLSSAGLSTSGPQARISGITRELGQATGFDEQARIFKSQREGYLSALAKSLGEVGSLSDQDVARARELVPSLGDTQAEAAEKIRRLRMLISDNKQTILSVPQSTGGLSDFNELFNQGATY